MATLHKLTDLKCKAAGPGRIFDGGGLVLFTKANGTKYFMLRYTIHGRRREMGIGPYGKDQVTLQEARDKAADARRLLRDGLDPMKERDTAKAAADESLDKWIREAFEATKVRATWGRWAGPYNTHIGPKLGKTPVTTLTVEDFVTVLRAKWASTRVTIDRALGHVSMALEQAAAAGLDVDVGLVKKARLRLGAKNSKPVQHHEAMPYSKVAEFVAQVPDKPAGWALELLILTGVRSDNARSARVDEFDLDEGVWTVPGEKMKTGLPHAVPLSQQALAIVRKALPYARRGHLFPPARGAGDLMGKRAIPAITEALTGNEYKTHGFRSSFRQWISEECPDVSFEVAEVALAHTVGNATSRAYNRTDYLEQRAGLMQRWADYVTHSATVV